MFCLLTAPTVYFIGHNLPARKVLKAQLALKALKVQLVRRVLKAHKALPRQFPVQLDHKA
jgi:hypothetical protein